jgi:hypothetical protein
MVGIEVEIGISNNDGLLTVSWLNLPIVGLWLTAQSLKSLICPALEISTNLNR